MDLLDIDVALPRRAFELCATLTLGAETVALIGPSGSGKSSLLRTVAGLEHPRAGRIAFGAEVWFDAARGVHLRPEHRRVGYLPQDYGLFPHLDVAANVRFAARRNRPDLLERVGIAHLAHARPHELSGGERQRAALARALAREPRVLLLDEPFGALDLLTRELVRDELAELLAALRLPTLLVTHSFDDATALAGRVGVLDSGRLVQLAGAATLLREPATALVAGITGANVRRGTATPGPAGSTIALEGGGELESETAASGPVQISVHPWELRLADPSGCALTDRVLAVRRDHGRLVVRLARFTVHGALDSDERPDYAAGELVGLRAAPADVRVLSDRPPAMHDDTSRTVSLQDAAARTVGEVMIRKPKTLPADALVSDVRRAFERPTVRTVLLSAGERFAGAIERGGLPADAPDGAPAAGYVEKEPLTATPAMPMSEALELLSRRHEPRLIVLDEDGVTLRGLLCANGSGDGFCIR
jgi:molybdate transport system ATP-binding protein